MEGPMLEQDQGKNATTALSTEDIRLINKMKLRSRTKRTTTPPIMIAI
jgi:hypothetical protein